jgi:hypothetical protein
MLSATDNNRLNVPGFASEIEPVIVLGMLNTKYHFVFDH